MTEEVIIKIVLKLKHVLYTLLLLTKRLLLLTSDFLTLVKIMKVKWKYYHQTTIFYY
jgi:hypothetical protein